MKPSSDQKLRVLVLGYLVRGPLGGLAWHHLQYVLGLHKLGHEVFFLEDSDDYPSCYDPLRHTTDCNPDYGLAFAAQTFKALGLAESWAYYDAHSSTWMGPCADKADAICASADLFLNVSGVNPVRPWLENVPMRVLIDTDPAFTQVKHLQDPGALALAQRHTHYFSFGENIGKSDCTIPEDGLPWRATRQPIFIDAWEVTPGRAKGKFTTVMQWDSYERRSHNGTHFGMKAESFEQYIDIPKGTNAELELAIGSKSAPRDLLRENGWLLRDPLQVTKDPWSYQKYIQESKGEFSVAKHGYVISNSGWFSERSGCYLASGRPVIVQDTGIAELFPTDCGLTLFKTPSEALVGLDLVINDYDNHCDAARNLAEEYFDSELVLAELIDTIFSSETPAFA